jgi:antitoxin MazE
MQVSKWGNSLAIRLPAALVEALKLEEGDDIEITLAGTRAFQIDKDRRKEKALARLKASNWTLPAGFKFDREEANERK